MSKSKKLVENNLPEVVIPQTLVKVINESGSALATTKDESGLTLAEKLALNYSPFIIQVQEQMDKLKVLSKGNKEDCASAKRIALDLGKVCSALEKQKKIDKEYYSTVNKYIDGLFNTVEGAARTTQKDAKDISDFFENQEKERLNKLKEERIAILSEFTDGGNNMKLEEMDVDSFNSLVEAFKIKKEAQIKAEKEQEEKALEQAKKDAEERQKALEEANKLKAEKAIKDALRNERLEILSSIKATHSSDVADLSEEEWDNLLEVKVKEFESAEVERQRMEKELELEKKKKLELEKEKQIMAAKMEEMRKLEEKAKADAEKLRLEAEEKAIKEANAPDKEKLIKFINELGEGKSKNIKAILDLKSPDAINISDNIEAKFIAFKTWALVQIGSIK